MVNNCILVVDDEIRMRKLIKDFLVAKGYSILEAEDGEKALEAFEENKNKINLVLLDVMMPKLDGWSVLRQIRQESKVPIIMLTARGEEQDELFGFELGVDEYISKPFSPKILVARVEAILKRTAPDSKEVKDYGGVEIDKEGRTVKVDGKLIELSLREYELLTYLVENKDIALSRDKILNNVWNYDYYGDSRTIDSHIKKIRHKLIIIFLILVNNFVLGRFYLYSKRQTLKSVYRTVNDYYNNDKSENFEEKLEQIAIQNNFDILIRNNENVNIYTSNKDFYSTFGQMNEMTSRFNIGVGELIEQSDNFVIKKIKDSKNGITYILLSSTLDNGYLLYIRIPISSIQESVKISNNFLYLMAGFAILIAAVIVSYVSRKFTDPILELNDIAKKMSNLDFSHKYRIKDVDDEINNLGRSINVMSDKLERTINQLRNSNIELEKDIEEKSKIDEMRKSFISDVSHELKTPIALIQGYSEGLLENVNTDEESRKFYAEVILDETNKMDKLVKQLLELMKLEYGKRQFNDKKFNIVEVEKEVVRKSKVMLEEKKVKIEFNLSEEINVFADDFYIEQVISNYITNAIKHVKEIDGKKVISIVNEVNIEKNKVRVKIFNTGENIAEEHINRIWNRFYKVDESRNRTDGGTGIGLSFVKAIMNNYGNRYGVTNKDDGVEFYFDLDLIV